MNEKISEVSSQINQLEKQMTIEADRAIIINKLDKLRPEITGIIANKNQLTNTMTSYANLSYDGKNELIGEIVDFIKKYKNLYYETSLVGSLFTYVEGDATLPDSIIDLARKYQQNPIVHRQIRTSTQKTIYELLFFIYAKIEHGYSVFELAIDIQANLTGNSMESSYNFLRDERKSLLDTFSRHSNATFEKLNDESDLDCYLSINEDKKIVKFINVFQTTFLIEEEIRLPPNDRNDCSFFCEDFNGRNTDIGTSCDGTVYECARRSSLKYKKDSAYDRIYQGFNKDENGWWGHRSESGAISKVGIFKIFVE